MTLKLLQQEDRQTWLEVWRRMGCEPYAHPDYVLLWAGPSEVPAALVMEMDTGQTVLLPLILRRIPSPLLRGLDELNAYKDAVSPYGYGGPYASGPVDWIAFYSDVIDWMLENRVVSFFLRSALQHELPQTLGMHGRQMQMHVHAKNLSDNIVVDLTLSTEERWRQYAHKVRKNVNKADRAGLRVRIQTEFLDFDSFLSIYHSTMARRAADSWYFFDEIFFRRLGVIPGICLIADVIDASRVISTELVLVSESRLYSFLGGTLPEAFRDAPNDLLKHEVIQWGHRTGRTEYILGGGFRPLDGIFRYKKGFEPEGARPFHGIQLVGDRNVYRELCRLWDSSHVGEGDMSDLDFFPAYRRPVALD